MNQLYPVPFVFTRIQGSPASLARLLHTFRRCRSTSDDAGALQCAGIRISFSQPVLIFLIAFDQIRGILMQESHAEIDGEGIDHLTLFAADLFDQETGADLVI